MNTWEFTDNYIEIEAICDDTISIHLKDNHICVDAYGIYPSLGVVLADMPINDWEDLCNREEYENDLKELAELSDDMGDENISFCIPFNRISDISLNIIQCLIEKAQSE